MERPDESSVRTVDLLVCGNGRWGGLGNNVFSSAQGTPVRAKNISGLVECMLVLLRSNRLLTLLVDCEQSQTRKAILPHAISVSPTGHVLLTLDTVRSQSGDSFRDLVVWGSNYEYELGNGKRGSLAVPTMLQTPDGERYMLRQTSAKEIRDLSGSVWKCGVMAEQKAVGGYGNSVVYWKIC